MGIMTNRNNRSAKLILFLLALAVLAGFQPGFAETQDIERLRRAAEQGDAAAQYSLGVSLLSRQGVPNDDTEAVKWFRKAAEQGLRPALNTGPGWNLCTTRAEESRKTTASRPTGTARRLNREHASMLSPTWLAGMYANGEGVPEDDQEAVRWYRKAAEQGARLMLNYNLGVMYANGEGVPEDNTGGSEVVPQGR